MSPRLIRIAGVILLLASVPLLFLAYQRYQQTADEVRQYNEFKKAKRAGSITVSFETMRRQGTATGEVEPYLPGATKLLLAAGAVTLLAGLAALVVASRLKRASRAVRGRSADDFIRFACPSCGKSVKAMVTQAGERVRCPGRACRQPIRVPGAQPPEAAPAGSDWPWYVGGTAAALVLLSLCVWFLTRDRDVPAEPSPPVSKQVAASPQVPSSGNTPATATSGKPPSAEMKETPKSAPVVAKEPPKAETLLESPIDVAEFTGKWEGTQLPRFIPAIALEIGREGTGTFTCTISPGQGRFQATGPLALTRREGKWHTKLFDARDWVFALDRGRARLILSTTDYTLELAKKEPLLAGDNKPGPVKSGAEGQGKKALDPALNGDWVLDELCYAYSGRVKDALLVNTKHTLAIKDDTFVVSGEVEGQKTTVKYTLQADAAASPKRYRLTNAANADDTESGVYWTDGKLLLVRTEKFGAASPKFEFSGVRLRQANNAGNDADIPPGFLLNEGDTGPRVLAFRKVTNGK